MSSSKNTGKKSEKLWEDHFTRMGKRAYFHRFVDASEITGKTGRVAVSATAQPSDYLLTVASRSVFAEVKSTGHATAFNFNLFGAAQLGESRRILAAGGNYEVFIHHLLTNTWYRIPMAWVHETRDGGRASLKWAELSDYKWEISL